jgi:hypothetical protein
MPFSRFNGSQEYCRRITLLLGDEVQHPMHAVCEVDIGMAWWTPHRPIALRETNASVTPIVICPDVGFRFGNHAGNALITLDFNQSLTEKFTGDNQRGTIEEVAYDHGRGGHL